MRRFPMLLAPLALLLALNLAACGNKGPLVRAVDAQDVEETEDVEDAEDADDFEAEDAEPAPAADDPVDEQADEQAGDAEQTDVPPPADPGHG